MKNILENFKESYDARQVAAEFIEGLGFSVASHQAHSEEAMHAVQSMRFRDIGIEREGEIGQQRGLKTQIKQGNFDAEIVFAVAVRSLCRDMVVESVRSAQETNRQKKQRTVQ